jgi:predicted DNA-binding protein (MmcQ/YjbR family)
MNIEEFRNYCLEKKAVTESFPFDETTLVFKVMNKMFALTDVEDDFSINLKCDPEKAIQLREQYPDLVLPGYHMNKKLWNTVVVDGKIPDNLLYQWIDESYDLIVASLPKAKRLELEKE